MMSPTLPVEDLSKTYLEHSMVINNFVIKVGSYPYLYKTVTAENKNELQMVMFPNLHISFDELFDIGEY